MNLKLVLLGLLVLGFTTSHSQKLEEKVLMTVDGQPVYASEFLRVYNKNLDLVEDESQKDVDKYLDLFIDYKLKVKEAEEQGLDTILRFKREFNTYRNQLATNYLTDTNVTEELVKEAYERSVNEVNASHILIRVDPNASPQDSLKAYNKALEIRNKAIAGGNFDALAKQYSEDPSAKTNNGELGWFSALKMVYPFENSAYNTEVGEVSMPFRTRFGFHILKVNNRRPSPGEVEVAHIMVQPKEDTKTFDAKKRINEIYEKVMQGEDFAVLAKQFSDDTNSARDGGKLTRFGSGKLASEVFENMAFGLKKQGQVSMPFETRFGWHIVKLLNRYPVKSFDEMRSELEQKVTKDSRASRISSSLIKKLKTRYQAGDQKEAKAFFNTFITDEIYDGNWAVPQDTRLEQPLLKVRDITFTYRDFAEYAYAKQANSGVNGNKEVLIANWMTEFVDAKILQYHRLNLEQEDEDFKNIVQEYRDGLLLFDLMETNIWKRAKKDTVALRRFYESNKEKYEQGKRISATIAKVNNKADAKTVRTLMKQGKTKAEIKDAVNLDAETSTLFNEGTFAINAEGLPKKLKIKEGISKIYEDGNYYSILNITSILPAGIKPFKDTKGIVISDYQNSLEKDWLKSLRNTYTVSINKETLNTLKQQLEN